MMGGETERAWKQPGACAGTAVLLDMASGHSMFLLQMGKGMGEEEG